MFGVSFSIVEQMLCEDQAVSKSQISLLDVTVEDKV